MLAKDTGPLTATMKLNFETKEHVYTENISNYLQRAKIKRRGAS